MRNIEFRICYTDQKGKKSLIYSNESDKFMISLDGTVLENYGSKEKPMWEIPFDCDSPPVLQQYVDLKDKNGKKIFEGDIIKVDRWHFKKPEYEIIEDGSEIAYIYMGSTEWLMSFDHIRYDDIVPLEQHSWARIEVIGNIFENPELVKYE